MDESEAKSLFFLTILNEKELKHDCLRSHDMDSDYD